MSKTIDIKKDITLSEFIELLSRIENKEIKVRVLGLDRHDEPARCVNVINDTVTIY